MRLDELAKQIGAELVGDGSIDVTSAAALEDAKPGQLSFLANPKYAKLLETTGASAIIAASRVSSDKVAVLKSTDPYYAFARAVIALQGHRKHPHAGVSEKAHVDPTATLGTNTVVYPGVFIGPNVKIGNDCIVYPNAVIYDDCVVGDRVIIQANAVIGQDGFGYATHKGEHFKIPQIGNVTLEDDVEIGACTCIARAALGSTTIGKGTKLDCLVMIGHNTKVGEHGILVAQAGVAGSTTIGHHATIAGQAGIAGHLKLGNNITIGAKAGIMADVDDQTTMIGTPASTAQRGRRIWSITMHLPELVDRIKQLEQQVQELADSGDTPLV